MTQSSTYTLADFLSIVAQLRHPETGCPWDLKQNFQTMIPHLLEESYEVVEAIEQQDMPNLREELGDLLLQVVFLSQLATEQQLFTFDDVVNDVAAKLIRRHPHVFGEEKAKNEEEALQHWQAMKQQEHKKAQCTSILDNIPQAFTALMRADKLQKRCASVGFDWQTIEPVFDKVAEELQEVQQEVTSESPNSQAIQSEIGDLFFAVANLSRQLGFRSEETLRLANQKFERRFRKVEEKLQTQGKMLQESSLAEMDLLWDEVKKEEKP